MPIADSLYRQVVNMWFEHLKEVVVKKTEISDLDTILGKKDDDDSDGDSVGKYYYFLIVFCFFFRFSNIN